ncbi:MAG TPA: PadR family transcriptional regulator [Aggregatilinea sp.]|jgi:DNA-binding PadR family transcriptional regulator|uniref:PadR family transcriptional regulator n=1 Tax=Aggregatilinea sp. TaxID=2806333 RepID=UPI002CE6DFE0|nr:PadR family transcriptional regulator [Aggregatilinea sp.]HML23968.1 PadR family transcriptional regulator [Aggregatilinea sp.]
MTDAELALLSIVAEGPVHGYDIQTIITQRGLRAWTNIGVSSMYYVIDKLERQGLVESEPGQHAEGPSRREYRITPAGYGVLQTAVADLLSTPRETASGFELGLANLDVLRASQLRSAFIAYRQDLVMRLGQARERWQQLVNAKATYNVIAIFEHRLVLLQAELDWVTQFIDQWEAQAPPDDDLLPEPADIPRAKQVVLPHDPDSLHRASTMSGPADTHLKRTMNRLDRETPPLIPILTDPAPGDIQDEQAPEAEDAGADRQNEPRAD